MTKLVPQTVGWTMVDEERYLVSAYDSKNIPVLEGYLVGLSKRKVWGALDKQLCAALATKYLKKLLERPAVFA